MGRDQKSHQTKNISN